MMKWTIQEVEHLRNLVENYGQSCWQNISKEMNFKFNKTSRTGRQCRQKYINYARFNDECQRNTEWTPEEEKILLKLYKDAGPSWSSFVINFNNKSENSIKNKFYNNLRRISRKLEENQKKFFKNCRSHIGYDSIVTILQIFIQIQRWNTENCCKWSQESKIWQNKEKILEMAFRSENQFDQKELSNLVLQIKEINKNLRCFGIYKSTNKKSWKLTRQRVESILRFDCVSDYKNSEKKQLDSNFNMKSSGQSKQTSAHTPNFIGIEVQVLESLYIGDYENEFQISNPISEIKNLGGSENFFLQILKQLPHNESMEFAYD